MIKLTLFILKTTVFALAVLILGNTIHWQGKTISDQVKIGMAQAERTWMDPLAQKIKNDEDIIPAAEKKKLRGLLERLKDNRD